MIEQIRPSALNDWFSKKNAAAGTAGAAVLLDVREPAEWRAASVRADGPLFSVQRIPMGELPSRLAELDRSRPVACLCHHGARSQRVAMFLAQQGFAQVANIAGGIDAWALEHDSSVPRY